MTREHPLETHVRLVRFGRHIDDWVNSQVRRHGFDGTIQIFGLEPSTVASVAKARSPLIRFTHES